MSLREEFEADVPKHMLERVEHDPERYLDPEIEMRWYRCQRATERALRIIQEEYEADYDDPKNRRKAIERRIKGDDSNG